MSLEDLEYEAASAEEAGDLERAYALYAQLAADGNGYAMSALARYHADGFVVERDIDKSIEWDLRAISAGSDIALFNLAVTYRQLGDMRKSREFFERSLSRGDISAALELAKLYLVSEKEWERVCGYLEQVTKSRAGVDVSEDGFEEALGLLKEVRLAMAGRQEHS